MSLKFISCIYFAFLIFTAVRSSQQNSTVKTVRTEKPSGSNRVGREGNYVEYSQPVNDRKGNLHFSNDYSKPVDTRGEIIYSQKHPNSYDAPAEDQDSLRPVSYHQSSDDSSSHAEDDNFESHVILAAPMSLKKYEPSQRSHPWGPYRMRGDMYHSGGLAQSGSNVDWSIWKAGGPPPPPPSPPPDSGNKGMMMMMKPPKGDMPPSGPAYHIYHHFENDMKDEGPWKDDPWKDDPWKDLPGPMMMNGMPDMMMMMKGAMPDDKKHKGLLDKLASLDPMKILLAGAIPLSLLLAGVLPILMNMMMNGTGTPTINTIATGNSAGGGGARELENSMFEPIMKAISDLASTSLGESPCFQKVFCTAAKGSQLADPVREVFYKASSLVDDRWIEAFGLKDLLQSILTGKCENIQCPSTELHATKKTMDISHQTKGDPSE